MAKRKTISKNYDTVVYIDEKGHILQKLYRRERTNTSPFKLKDYRYCPKCDIVYSVKDNNNLEKIAPKIFVEKGLET